MKILGGFSTVALLLSLPFARCTEWKYTNSSSSIVPTVTPAPTFCGGCRLIFEVHASVWWPTVYTNYISTLVYTVDKDTGSTIGSHLTPANFTAIEDLDYGVNFTSVYKLRDGGAVEFTYLNTLTNGPATTVIQYNEITMNHTNWGNGYILSTAFYNTTGTPTTQCLPTYYTINGTRPTNDPLIGLPSQTTYSYTTVVPFVSTYNMSDVITYGLDSLGSYVATYLNLTIPACTDPAGGGVGTLKVGVTALTAVSTFYAEPQVTSTPSPEPPVSPSPTPPAPTPTPTPPSPTPEPPATPSPSPPSSPSPNPPPATSTPVIPPSGTTEPGVTPTSPPDDETPPGPGETQAPPAGDDNEESTTITAVITGPSGPQTIVTAVPIGEDLITATISGVITGPSGLETVVQTTEIPIASYFSSVGGAPGSGEGATAAATSGTSSDAESTAPLEFTGAGNRGSTNGPILALVVGVMGLMFNV